LVIVVVAIARCNSRSRLAKERDQSTSPTSPLIPSVAPTPATGLSASATPIVQVTPPVDVAKTAANVQQAVVAILVFEPSGKLLRTGTGVFVSENGKILTTRSLMGGRAHA